MHPKMVALIEWLVFTATLLLLVTAFSIAPDERGHSTHEQLGLAPCPHLVRTQEPCFACGMTTSFSHTVRFQWTDAVRAHPGGFFLCLVVIFVPLWIALARLRGRSPWRILRAPWPAIYLFVGVGIVWWGHQARLDWWTSPVS